jgi:hypothetical protein
MRRHSYRYLLAILLLGLGTQLWAAPRTVERWSTANGRDLERVSVTGTVTQIEGQRATLRTEDGARVTVNLGPRRFWEQRGYSLRSGVDVTVSGWGDLYGDDGGFLFAGSIDGPGFYFELWDSEGYPQWADRGDYCYDWRPSFDWADRWYCDGDWRGRDRCYAPPPPPPPRVYFGWYWGHPRHHDRDRHDGPPPRWDRDHDRDHHRPGPPPPPPRGKDDDDRNHDRHRRGRR